METLGGHFILKKIIALVALLSLITFAIVQAMDKHDQQSEKKVEENNDHLGGLTVGAKAPDFKLGTLEGEAVSLSQYKGKKVLVNFWATWCPPCKKEMPALQKFSEKAGEDMVILAVNIDPENDPVAFANTNKLTFPILLDHQDANQPVNNQYQVLAIPTTFFIDSKGIIQNKFIGEMKLKDMEENMNRLQ